MDKSDAKSAVESDLTGLERWIDELVHACQRLKDENRSLRQQHQAMASERAGLLQKNELARSRIEAMIAQLRSMEHGA